MLKSFESGYSYEHYRLPQENLDLLFSSLEAIYQKQLTSAHKEKISIIAAQAVLWRSNIENKPSAKNQQEQIKNFQKQLDLLIEAMTFDKGMSEQAYQEIDLAIWEYNDDSSIDEYDDLLIRADRIAEILKDAFGGEYKTTIAKGAPNKAWHYDTIKGFTAFLLNDYKVKTPITEGGTFDRAIRAYAKALRHKREGIEIILDLPDNLKRHMIRANQQVQKIEK